MCGELWKMCTKFFDEMCANALESELSSYLSWMGFALSPTTAQLDISRNLCRTPSYQSHAAKKQTTQIAYISSRNPQNILFPIVVLPNPFLLTRQRFVRTPWRHLSTVGSPALQTVSLHYGRCFKHGEYMVVNVVNSNKTTWSGLWKDCGWGFKWVVCIIHSQELVRTIFCENVCTTISYDILWN